MKRSEINILIQQAMDFFGQHQFLLPPFAHWSPADWQARGPEAREALLAMAARGGGTLVGVRAAAHAGVLEHLEALASLGTSKEGVAALIGASVHVIVRMVRGADGVRRLESIAELGTEGTVDLFEHGENGFASTGYRPSFMQG